MPEPASRPGKRWQAYAQGAAVLAAVLLVLFVLRPTDDARPSPTDDAAPVDVEAEAEAEPDPEGPLDEQPPEPRSATDEEFCTAFVRMAQEVDPEPLQQRAEELVAVGIPENMSLTARSGYVTLMAGVYESTGSELAPGALGAPASPYAGGDDAFSAYLSQYCPP